MDDFVNRLTQIRRLADPAGIEIEQEGENLCVRSPLGSARLRLVFLYRPSSRMIEQASAPDNLLVITAPTHKALEAASQTNYLVLPDGACRIVTKGIVLILESPSPRVKASHQVKLTGLTGIVAETLLLGGAKQWSVRELAFNAHVSPALAHRVVMRLEREGLLLPSGSGRGKTRVVRDFQALAELWSQEEKKPDFVRRGFLYGSSPEAIARQVLAVYPEGAVGGTLAANLYEPTLTKVPPPLRIWVKGDFDLASVNALGFEWTNEGANIEFVASKDDPWHVHGEDLKDLPTVSKARAWLEISGASGRTQELANALFSELEKQR